MEHRPLSDSNAPCFDPEAQEFEDPKIARIIRHGFIKKVYSIVSVQLLFSVAIGALFTLSSDLQSWVITSGSWLPIVSAVLALVFVLVLICVPSMARNYPTNYILLAAFTSCEGLALGTACGVTASQYGGTMVLQAVLCTAVVVVGLTIFAFQTKYDFVSWAGGLTLVLLGLMTFGLVRMFFPHSRILEAVMAAAMAVVFAIYIVIDTQMLIGRGKVKLSEDDYILGALMLYIDIVNLFLQILKLLKETQGRD